MNRNLIIGLILSAIAILAALVSFIWTPFDHVAMDIPAKLTDPKPDPLVWN